MKTFTWERGPFEKCFSCGEVAFGLLSAGGHTLTKRCAKCRWAEDIPLPELNKKAVYLDQFMFSLIYNVKNDGNLPSGHELFAKEVYQLLRRCVLLQQIFLPHSEFHHEETNVFHSAIEFRSLYEFFGGDVSLKNSRDVQLDQTLIFAEAFFDGREPEVPFSLDEIADSHNDWLPDMHIGVKADYSQFADDTRRVRGETHNALKNLAKSWTDTKPSFEDVLEKELDAFGPLKRASFNQWFRKLMNPSPDAMSLLESSMSHIYHEFKAFEHLLKKREIPEEQYLLNISKFLNWKKNRDIPYHKISCYLFAAISQRVVMGERKIIDRGLMNDVSTISTYAPYVHALFIDKKCASILSEEPLASELEYKARIFSLNDTEAFMNYLNEIEAGTPDDVREFAARIYGVE